jgi:hypothetical protein
VMFFPDRNRNLALPEAKLARLIRPAGYFHAKTRPLRSFLRGLVEQFGGDLQRLFAGKTPVVRERSWPPTESAREPRPGSASPGSFLFYLRPSPTSLLNSAP